MSGKHWWGVAFIFCGVVGLVAEFYPAQEEQQQHHSESTYERYQAAEAKCTAVATALGASRGYNLKSTNCKPNGTMCFIYDDGRGRDYRIVVLPSRQTQEGYYSGLRYEHEPSFDDRGRLSDLNISNWWADDGFGVCQ